jgi:hypothetical protein
MTDPKYIADRDKLAEQYADSVEQDWTGCSHNAFFVEDTFRLAFDAGYSRANSELRAEIERLKSINKMFKLYGTTDCENNNDGYMSADCSGRVTLFIANTKCIGCDPEGYKPETDGAGAKDE